MSSSAIPFGSAISVPIADLLGATPSAIAYASPDTVGGVVFSNAEVWLNNALAGLAASSRGDLFIPGGTYVLQNSWNINASVRIHAEPNTVTLSRGANIPVGKGLLDITHGGVTIENIIIDGAVTTPVGVLYSALGSPADPMATVLTTNTSIWVHGGISDIRIKGVTIQHTGGYSILLDCTAANINFVVIEGCAFINNRPHLFGTSGGDLNYGSWTGGIHAEGDGTSFALSNLLVYGCRFQCVTGNCVWTHAYALAAMHSNIRVSNNSFTDIGLDGILCAAVSGGTVTGNTFRRVGYISLADNTVGTPKWLAQFDPVAIDTAGLALNCNYSDNSIVSVNGQGIDTDGLGYSVVSNNSMRIPVSGDPEYTVDQVTLMGPSTSVGVNWMAGIQQSNSNNVFNAGANNIYEGNQIYNFGGEGIGLYGSRYCKVSNNIIFHPDTGYQRPPIEIGNIGTGPYQRSDRNYITNNTIYWSPAATRSVIQEIPVSAAYTGQANYVWSNTIITTTSPPVYEFGKDPNSNSISAVQMWAADATVTGSAQSSLATMERLHNSGNDVLRWFATTGGSTHITMQLIDKGTASTTPLLNVAQDGGAVTGAITTGNRTTSSLQDTMATGFLYADNLLGLSAVTYSDAYANSIPSTTALFRYSAGVIQFSVSVSAGARVWQSIGSGGGSPGGADTNVQFNNAGGFGGVANFTWDNTLQKLRVVGVPSTAGIVVAAGYIQSDEGFYSPGTSFQVFNAPNGGIYALYAVCNRYVQFVTEWNGVAPPSLASGAGIGWNTGSLYYYWNGSAWASVDFASSGGSTSPGGVDKNVQFNNLGSFGGSANYTWNNTTQVVTIAGTSNAAAALSINNGFIQCTGGFATTSSSNDAINALSGGVHSKFVNVTQYIQLGANAVAPSSVSPAGGLAYRSTSTYWYWNGAAWAIVDFSVSGGAPGGVNTNVQFNNSGGFGGSTALVWNNAAQTLTVTGTGTATTGTAINVSLGYVVSLTGFSTGSTGAQAINAPNGGVLCSFTTCARYLQWAQNAASPPSLASGGGMSYAGGGLYWYWNGSLWAQTAAFSAINSSGVFIGPGALCGTNAIQCGGINPLIGATQFFGRANDTIVFPGAGFTVGASTFHNISIKGGVVCGYT